MLCLSSSSVVSCAFSALCTYSMFGHHHHPLGYLCAKLRFFHNLSCWARPWKKIMYSLAHSPSLLDWCPGTSEWPLLLCLQCCHSLERKHCSFKNILVIYYQFLSYGHHPDAHACQASTSSTLRSFRWRITVVTPNQPHTNSTPTTSALTEEKISDSLERDVLFTVLYFLWYKLCTHILSGRQVRSYSAMSDCGWAKRCLDDNCTMKSSFLLLRSPTQNH